MAAVCISTRVIYPNPYVCLLVCGVLFSTYTVLGYSYWASFHKAYGCLRHVH